MALDSRGDGSAAAPPRVQGLAAAAEGSEGSEVSGQQLLAWRSALLRQGGSGADLDWLLDQAGGLRWPELQRLRLNPERQLRLRLGLEPLAALWQRHRRSGEPLQYLVGLCSWRDLELEVGPAVLIPRPETELLVELALGCFRAGGSPCRWADLGTGSGCLAVALARAWPDARGWAVDCSPAALAVAAGNLRRHGLEQRVSLRCGSWWQPLREEGVRFDLVLSNPPYIPTSVLEGLEPGVRDHEPREALDGGVDGLKAIAVIADEASLALAPGGWLLLEHHHDQSAAVLELLRGAGLEEVHSAPDLEGQQRFALARCPGRSAGAAEASP